MVECLCDMQESLGLIFGVTLLKGGGLRILSNSRIYELMGFSVRQSEEDLAFN